MNTQEIMLPEFGEDIPVVRELLTADNIDSVSGFCGTVDDIDFIEYLKNYAIEDTTSRTFIYRDQTTGNAVAFVSISCSMIMEEYPPNNSQYASAVLIDRFMVDERYRHKQYFADNPEHVLASVIFADILEFVSDITKSVIGARYVVLYATPEAHSFYLKKCNMLNFSEFMVRSNDPKTDYCVPMYYIL